MKPRDLVILIVPIAVTAALVLAPLPSPARDDAHRASTTQAAPHSSAPASSAPAIASPVRYRHIVRQSPPMHIHVIHVDLTDPRVRVRVCSGGDDPDGDGPWQTTLRSASQTAEQNNLFCAVNGNFFAAKESRKLAGRTIPYFSGNWSRAWGWAMSDGKLWGDDPGSRCSLLIDRAGHATIDRLPEHVPEGACQIVTGSELIVTDGKITSNGKDRAPRTSVGIDRAGRTLVLVVVDGRKLDYSAGMTSGELAQELINLGCDRAIMLDGGGSSTMVMRDPLDEHVVRVVNQPSDGHDLPISMSLERPVANVVGVEIVETK
ncbi:hypothetical protein BH09PLA1_BH09PLA1_17700 [soil metagenome]